jgi:tRNA (guanine-N7-)-methyltransferase
VRARHKKWALPYLQGHPEFSIEALATDDPFYDGEVYLEIGAGKGDFVTQMALRGGNWLALERDISVCGLLAKKVEAAGLGNIRVMAKDFDQVAPTLKEGAFAGIFLNFSDPWPKHKHAKRRLTTGERLKTMEALLKPGGFLKVKTDNDELFFYTMDEAKETTLLLTEARYDYALAEDDALTEYEKDFRAALKPIHRLVYRRPAKE